jgi:hypothetical protein
MESSKTGTIFLRLLLNKYFTGKPDALAKILPQEDADRLSAVQLPHRDPEALLFVPEKWLASYDSSWLKPAIEKLSKPLQEVYEKAFPKIFNKPDSSKYNSTVQDFLIQYLHQTWEQTEPPPKNLLPEWEMTPLLYQSREELLDIANLLAMHDLVEEMRQIVDKRLLQAVLQHLTSEQQHYLRVLLRQKSRIKPTGLSVKELLKEGNKFPQILHKFGLQRLAFALSGASDDFVWHILHTLDFARAKFLQNHIKKEEVPNQTPQALLQVQHIIHFLKTETAP